MHTDTMKQSVIQLTGTKYPAIYTSSFISSNNRFLTTIQVCTVDLRNSKD